MEVQSLIINSNGQLFNLHKVILRDLIFYEYDYYVQLSCLDVCLQRCECRLSFGGFVLAQILLNVLIPTSPHYSVVLANVIATNHESTIFSLHDVSTLHGYSYYACLQFLYALIKSRSMSSEAQPLQLFYTYCCRTNQQPRFRRCYST